MSFKISVASENSAAYAGEICGLWTAAFRPQFPLTPRLWQQNTTGDPNFLPSDLLLARCHTGALAGLALTKRYRPEAHNNGLPMEKYLNNSYLAVLAVAPEYQRQGLGRALLEQAEEILWQNGGERISLGGSLRHFFPGVPDNCQPAKQFFIRAGYNLDDSRLEYDLEGELKPVLFEAISSEIPAADYRAGRPGEEQILLSFLQEIFPGRWHYDMDLYLSQGGAIEDVIIYLPRPNTIQGFLMTYGQASRILGPSVYWHPEDPQWGGIGPLGISPSARGQGAGLGLVAAGMRLLYDRGARSARIDWTTLTGFYGRLGFQPVKAYYSGGKQKY